MPAFATHDIQSAKRAGRFLRDALHGIDIGIHVRLASYEAVRSDDGNDSGAGLSTGVSSHLHLAGLKTGRLGGASLECATFGTAEHGRL